VEAYLGRGFYSAVYKVAHPVTGGAFAMKVTPCQTYTDPDPDDVTLGGFPGKHFADEYQIHTKLANVAGVVDLLDVGIDAPVHFDDIVIDCNWMRMTYVKGRPLSDVVEHGPDTPRQAAQIALDLLALVDQMQQLGIHHNDLHGGNAVIEVLDESQARRSLIDPYTQLRVFDLGSAAEKSKSLHGDAERLNDIEHVAQHIMGMITAYERDNATTMSQRDLRLCAQLRRLAAYYYGRDRVRLPAPRDMASAIERVYNFAEQPARQPLSLDYLSQHFNAQTLPSQLAPELLHDPEGNWARRLMGPGPQLVAGMRGCGKTILLRSLEWSAHARQRNGETDDAYRTRAAEAPLGLFVSCASLLRKARASTVDAPLHRLFLAFAREALRALAAVDLDRIDEVRFGQLDEFTRHITETVAWFEAPSNARDLIALERAVEAALQRESVETAPTMSPHIAFERLAELVRSLAPMWGSKTVLYLLDDVSTRFLPTSDVEDVLSQLCLKSDKFGFKISTESQTLALTTPGGALAREGRDYEIFDLGREVLANLGGAKGVGFLEGVLRRRQEITPGAPTLSPKQILGCQPLQDVAKEIHATRSNKTPCYWGIQALAGSVCRRHRRRFADVRTNARPLRRRAGPR
jgi:serine/threonine protein kinase